MEIKLTNQELNEWIAQEIMGWIKVDGKAEKMPDYKKWDSGFEISSMTKWGWDSQDHFDPCNNLNHTYLMEEKIRGVESNWIKFCKTLFNLVNKPKIDDVIFPNQHFECYHASARQRCEAVYLTFGGGNDTRGTN